LTIFDWNDEAKVLDREKADSPSNRVWNMGRSDFIGPPIIVDGDGGPLFFASVSRAEGYIEAIDVRDGEYTACYDSEGRRVDIRLEQRPRLLLGRSRVGAQDAVVLQCAEEAPSHSAELRSLLIRSLQRIGVSNDWFQKATLEELVKKGAERFGMI